MAVWLEINGWDARIFVSSCWNKCEEVDGLELGDESYKLFLNTAGTKDYPDGGSSPDKTEGNSSKTRDGLKELLKYMDNTKDYPVESTQYGLIKKIDGRLPMQNGMKNGGWHI